MKKLLFFAASLSLMLSACTGYKTETIPNDPLKTQIYTLNNGMKVYMSVMKEQPRIQTAIAVKVGGKNDPKETTGLAHYFEHLMFKGTSKFGTSNYEAEKPLLDEIERLFEVYRKTTDEKEREALYHVIDSVSYEASKYAIPNEYDKLMALIGATGTNAYTSQDMTVFVEDIPSNQIDNWAKIQADRFRDPVIRGFHTELEAVYEEKNMSLTQDSRKILTSIDEALFPHHPYGTQTVLGTQEQLKNPSITNIKNYYKTYYVPNNIAICVSGDFDPQEMIAAIEKYFGDMVPNNNLPKLQFEPEQPITSPIVKDVYGPEAESVYLAWRLPKSIDPSNDVAQIAASILYNGNAGMIDLNLNQEQKAALAFAFQMTQPDYGRFVVAGQPLKGQSLDELSNLLLTEVEKLRKGEFDEELIQATINNYKTQMIKMMDNYEERTDFYVENFISGGELADAVHTINRISKITKEDIVAWANEYLKPEAYAIIKKHTGVDPNEQKIAAPKITPIMMNRDAESDFLKEIKSTEVKPIKPVFVDFEKDMSKFELKDGVEVLYKKNETTDLFDLVYIYNKGVAHNHNLYMSDSYIEYLGTEKMSAGEIAGKMYGLACSSGFETFDTSCNVKISGLSENMTQAMDITEERLFNAQGNDEILKNLKQDMLKFRSDDKLRQAGCFAALRNYMAHGEEWIKRTTPSDKELMAKTSDELLGAIRDLKDKAHTIIYYGPMSEEELKQALTEHHYMAEQPEPLTKEYAPEVAQSDKSVVYLSQYTSKQLYYIQSHTTSKLFDVKNDPEIILYNEYFGNGMNSIVFQELRESRGLAYSALANIVQPATKDNHYAYMAFIATQNDKMKNAIEAFDEIINNMPASETAFKIAKEGLISRLRTARTVKLNVLMEYYGLQRMGLSEDRDRQLFEKVQNMTLEDVKATQQKWAKDLTYNYGILGDIQDIDLNYLKTLGQIKTLSQEEIFGY